MFWKTCIIAKVLNWQGSKVLSVHTSLQFQFTEQLFSHLSLFAFCRLVEVVNDHSTSHGGSQVYSPHEVLHALYSCSWKADKDQQVKNPPSCTLVFHFPSLCLHTPSLLISLSFIFVQSHTYETVNDNHNT